MLRFLLKKPDTLGALASGLCLAHCVATPLLFIAHSCALSGCSSTPTWWKSIDYLFLVISFFAVYRSTKTSTKHIVKMALWISWFLLFLTLLNEHMNWLAIPEFTIYIVAFVLISLHLYNLNYCQCKTDGCCAKQLS